MRKLLLSFIASCINILTLAVGDKENSRNFTGINSLRRFESNMELLLIELFFRGSQYFADITRL